MKKKAFISGPILGMENNQDYRRKITEICTKMDFDVIDPWHREKSLCKGDKQHWWPNIPASGFVQRDLDDAERCDVMIVYLPKLSAGACMELFHAKRQGKKVIVVSEMDSLSPWIIIHSDTIVKNFRQLENALRKVQQTIIS